MINMTGMNDPPNSPLPPPISTFSRLAVLFFFLAAGSGTVGAIYRDRIDDRNVAWIAAIFLAITAVAFIRSMIRPRTTLLLISMGLSLAMIIFSMMIFLHI